MTHTSAHLQAGVPEQFFSTTYLSIIDFYVISILCNMFGPIQTLLSPKIGQIFTTIFLSMKLVSKMASLYFMFYWNKS